MDYQNRYQKFDWIETSLVRNTQDPRPESFRLIDPADITVTDNLGTHNGWRERRNLLLGKCMIHSNMSHLIDAAHNNTLSLAVFKPGAIVDFACEESDRNWDPVKINALRAQANQGELFADDTWQQDFKTIPKVPYKFFYRLADSTGKTSRLQILDWEIGQLYWNCLRAAEGDEHIALQKVRQKYLDEFSRTDLHLFLGTTRQFHGWATNPWTIIGVFPIPHEIQKSLF